MEVEIARKPDAKAVLLILVAAVALAPAAFGQQYLFNQANFATGVSPHQVVAADFNRNGQPDLAATDEADNTVSVLLATPSGTFSPKVAYATGNGPFGLATADFNGDGNPDLAVTNVFDDTVTILLGSSNGTFTAGSTSAVGIEPVAVATGDFNKDGKIDLAVINLGANTVSILLGNGDGTFQAQTTFATGAAPRSVAVGDFNGDGNADLAIANSGANTITILLGTGTGSFTAAASPATATFPSWVAVGDVNGDGFLDLAVTNEGSATVSVLLGNGNGTFQAHMDSAVGSTPTFVWVSDFNGDGKLDLAVVNDDSNTVSILLGAGNGTFQTHVDAATAEFPITLAAADFNGDGKTDLAVANSLSDGITVLLADGDGTFVERTNMGVGTAPDGIATGEFNSDTFLDVAVANSSANTISVLLGTGGGNFTVGSTPATGTGPADIASSDFNNDGKADLVTANLTASTVSVLLGNGDGTFGTHSDFATGTAPAAVAYGAFVTGNSTLDLVTANSGAKTVSVLLGNGNGTFQTHTDFTVGSGPVAIAVADLNNDGKLDLAVADFGSNQVSILLGTGTGSFGAQTTFTTGFEPTGIALGDFNGDGKMDLATANNTSVSILLGNGDGTFQRHVDFGAGNGDSGCVGTLTQCSNGIAIGDFNGDGKLDVVVSSNVGNVSEGTASVLLGNGNGTLQPQIQYSTGIGPSAVAAGSFTATSGLDFVTVNQTSNSISLFLNDPVIALFPPSINFGNVNVGSTGGPVTLTVTNPGTVSLAITSVTTSAPFSQTSGCVTTLAAGATCSASVSFTPTAPGTSSGSLSLIDTAVTSPQAVPLTGVGIGMVPAVTLTPTSLNFGSVAIGASSAAQMVTLQNTGNATLNITSIAASASYSETNTCGSSVPAGQSCTISVTFSPLQAGTIAGTITITDNALNSPQTVTLTGTGTGPLVTLSASSLNFGTVLVNTTSPSQIVTLTNTGNAVLDVTSIVIAGSSYQLTNNCRSTMAPNTSCNITIAFRPKSSGTLTGTVTITDNAYNSPQIITLTGQGTVVSLLPSSLSFGTVSVGSSSASQTITLKNTGTQGLTITSIVLTGANANDFSETTTCGASVPPGGTCAITVTFTPLADGALSASVSVTDNGGGSPQTAALSGTGSGMAPVVTVSPGSLNFGNVAVGTTSPPQNVTLTNIGNSALNITSIAAGTNYGQTNTCGSSLGAGLSCTISVTFTPVSSGTLNGTLTIRDNAGNSPQTVALTGVGTAPVVMLSPTSLNFGSVPVGSTSAAQTVTLTNTGNATLNITTITTTASYSQTNTCGSSVPANGNCTISVTFTPAQSGTINGTLSVTDNAAGSPQTVSLTGVGTTAPAVLLSPTSLTFNNVSVGTTSSAQTVTLTNTGNATLTISSIVASTNFAQTNTCGSSVLAGKNCTISVTFTPPTAGTFSGTVTITDNAANSPQQVTLSGTGVGGTPVVSLSPTSLTFATQLINTSSPQQTVTLTNTGTGNLTITSVTISTQYLLTNNCPLSPSFVAPGANCTILVAFKPTSSGTKTGTVSVTDNAVGSPHTVSLTGVGTVVSFSPTGLNFGTVSVGTSSAPQNVTLTNNAANQALSITSITITGTNMGDFSQTNTCGSSVPAKGTCTITVTFTPMATGARSANVSVADNGGGSPQLVPLSGTGQ